MQKKAYELITCYNNAINQLNHELKLIKMGNNKIKKTNTYKIWGHKTKDTMGITCQYIQHYAKELKFYANLNNTNSERNATKIAYSMIFFQKNNFHTTKNNYGKPKTSKKKIIKGLENMIEEIKTEKTEIEKIYAPKKINQKQNINIKTNWLRI